MEIFIILVVSVKITVTNSDFWKKFINPLISA